MVKEVGSLMVLTEVGNLTEREWSFYRGGQFHGGRMIMLRRMSLMEGERSCQRKSI